MPYSKLANINSTKQFLDEHSLHAKYKFGQNFLIDDNIIRKIIDISKIDKEAHDTILEVGPGIGTLSCALLNYSNLLAIEKDADLCEVLPDSCADSQYKLTLLHDDALKISEEKLELVCNGSGLKFPNIWISNLPYNIAATLILDYFQKLPKLQTAIVMVQKEVADRIKASKGTKDYGAYSIKLSMYAKVVDSFNVSRACFYPSPRVDSSVIKLERTNLLREYTSDELASISKLIDSAFAMRRKNIKNNLIAKYDSDTVDFALDSCNIDPKCRAETLDLKNFIALNENL